MRPTLPLFLLTALAAIPAAGAVGRDNPAPTRPDRRRDSPWP
ncbi:MAG: hypothetical protein U0104_13895 [Gemmatimonadales bacterium]|nr:hypothetical protein [Gemmatimonadales bacterium]